MHQFEAARRLVLRAIADRVSPAATVEVGQAAGALWRESFGALTYDSCAQPARTDTIYDLASLTKVLATTTIAARLMASGRLSLDARAADLMDEWSGADREGVTIRDFLEHGSGLPAYAPLFEKCRTPPEFRRRIGSALLDYAPGTRSVYSDLGFIALGWMLEAAAGDTLRSLWTAITPALDLSDGDTALTFTPPASWRSRIAPTRRDVWRGRLLVGEVDDNNAWALGGSAGHAGLFGTAGAVGRVALAWMRGLREAPGTLAPPIAAREVLETLLRPSTVPGSSRACGWDLMRPTSSCGTRMSREAFGHTGFTGTSLWIDPARDRYVVLLTNRVHPAAGSNEHIQQLRRSVHDAVMDVP